jgi:hypothetical protein
VNTDRVSLPSSATASSEPSALNATDSGTLPAPVENGEPETGVSTPPPPTENIDTACTLAAVSATASSEPFGLNATQLGALLAPVENGEPKTGVSTPPPPTEKTDTLSVFESAAASKDPSGLNATDTGLLVLPVENGEPEAAVSVPPAATVNTDTLLARKLAVATSVPSELTTTECGEVLAPVENGDPATSMNAGDGAATACEQRASHASPNT